MNPVNPCAACGHPEDDHRDCCNCDGFTEWLPGDSPFDHAMQQLDAEDHFSDRHDGEALMGGYDSGGVVWNPTGLSLAGYTWYKNDDGTITGIPLPVDIAEAADDDLAPWPDVWDTDA